MKKQEEGKITMCAVDVEYCGRIRQIFFCRFFFCGLDKCFMTEKQSHRKYINELRKVIQRREEVGE